MLDRSFFNNKDLVEFLDNLFSTNLEFSKSHQESFFDNFRDEQNPRLTILKCSDSRVQMESFDKTPQNGVFAIRNIGNQLVTCEGSVEFGVRILKTPFLLIIGHSGCGAIAAALNKKPTHLAIDKEINTLKLTKTELCDAIVENVHNQIVFAMHKFQDLVDSGQLTILGAIYDFKDDFGYGKGTIVLESINGETDYTKIQDFTIKLKKFHFLKRK